MTNIASLRRRLAEVVRRAPQPQLSDLNRMATGEMRQRLCETLKITPAELAERHHEILQQLRAETDRRGVKAP